MAQTVEVRFKGNRRDFFDWHDEAAPLRLNEAVVVEVERGLDFGWVNSVGDAALSKCGGCTSCSTSDAPVESPRPEGGASQPAQTQASASGEDLGQSPRPEGGASQVVQTQASASGEDLGQSPRPEGGASQLAQTQASASGKDLGVPAGVGGNTLRETPPDGRGDSTAESPRPEGGASQVAQTQASDSGEDLGVPAGVSGDTLRETPPDGRGDSTAESPRPEGGASQPAPRAKVVRRADANATTQHEELRRSEEDVRRQVIERAKAHELPMRISDTEWQWDRGRLSIYFTADRRVDFRALVRELATKFRTRIELRQIGVRDEAARLGGVGRCGREYCCSTWLTAPGPVNLALAKDQHLSLNPAQISGGCGRLLCCLKYEHEFYVTARKRFPKEGKSIRTLRGNEKVVAVDIFRERVFLRHDEQGPRILALLDLRDEVDQALAAGPAVAEAEPPAPNAPRRPPRSGPTRQ